MRIKRGIAICLALSVLLHTGAYVAVDYIIDQRIKKNLENMFKNGKKTGSKYDGAPINKPIPPRIVQVEIVSPPKEKGPGPKEKPKPKERECKNGFYEGIGISSGQQNGREIVSEVYVGYPADMAGIRPGDEIQMISDKEIRGPKGTVLIMYMVREGVLTIKTVTRDKICY